MKRTIKEYNASMDKIVPSKSFIPETEALMKKLRDEYAANSAEKTSPAAEVERIIINKDTDRRIKLKRLSMGITAAAAAIVCVIAVNTAGRVDVNVDTPMETENSAEKTTAHNIVSDTDTDATDSTDTDSDAGRLVQNMEVTSASETEDIDSNDSVFEEERITSVIKENDIGRKETAAKSERVKETQPMELFSANSNTVTENVPGSSEPLYTVGETSVSSGQGLVYDGTSSLSGYGWYGDLTMYTDEAEEDYEYDEALSDNTGIPVFVPNFGTEEFEEPDIEETINDEEGFGRTTVDPAADAYSLRFNDPTSGDELIEADSVYVPDSISELDPGEYYITINAGFDIYSADSGTFSVQPDRTLSDEKELDTVMNGVQNVINGKRARYSGEEKNLSDYRYIISVYSTDNSEDNALLFEIMFDRDTMVINRYDNGTVSSEEYDITDEDYSTADNAASGS